MLIDRAIPPGTASLQVVEEGTCSDHKPLIASIDLSNYGIYTPSPQPPGPPHKARRGLLTPSNASREALRASLSSYGKGRAAKIDRLYSTLDSINNTDVRIHFHAISSSSVFYSPGGHR